MKELSRREFFLGSMLAGLTALIPGKVFAEWNKKLFESKSLQEVYSSLGASGDPEVSNRILLDIPEISDTPDFIPVLIRSEIPKTEMIALLVERYVQPLVLHAQIPEGTEAYIKTAIKTPNTGSIRVIVKASGKYYMVSKQIKIARPLPDDKTVAVGRPEIGGNRHD